MTQPSGHVSLIPHEAAHSVDYSPTGMEPNVQNEVRTLLSSRLLKARVGREKQRYDDHTRLLVCIVVSRRRSDGSSEFLLISSSKHPAQWILPTGGWENDESVLDSALREANEEAGVSGDIVASLGTLDFYSHQSKSCRFFGFKLEVTHVFEDWAESTRKRKWVSLQEACGLLEGRPELVEMVARAAAG